MTPKKRGPGRPPKKRPGRPKKVVEPVVEAKAEEPKVKTEADLLKECDRAIGEICDVLNKYQFSISIQLGILETLKLDALKSFQDAAQKKRLADLIAKM